MAAAATAAAGRLGRARAAALAALRGVPPGTAAEAGRGWPEAEAAGPGRPPDGGVARGGHVRRDRAATRETEGEGGGGGAGAPSASDARRDDDRLRPPPPPPPPRREPVQRAFPELAGDPASAAAAGEAFAQAGRFGDAGAVAAQLGGAGSPPGRRVLEAALRAACGPEAEHGSRAAAENVWHRLAGRASAAREELAGEFLQVLTRDNGPTYDAVAAAVSRKGRQGGAEAPFRVTVAAPGRQRTLRVLEAWRALGTADRARHRPMHLLSLAMADCDAGVFTEAVEELLRTAGGEGDDEAGDDDEGGETKVLTFAAAVLGKFRGSEKRRELCHWLLDAGRARRELRVGDGAVAALVGSCIRAARQLRAGELSALLRKAHLAGAPLGGPRTLAALERAFCLLHGHPRAPPHVRRGLRDLLREVDTDTGAVM